MDNVVHEGIVLKNYIPKKQKLSVLDSSLGKIEVIFSNVKNNQRLFSGAYISYTIKSKSVSYVIENTNLLNYPQNLVDNNFIFFHHVLELSYYFLSLDQEATDIFKLLNIFYLDSKLVQTNLSKNIFLCKFFSKLGIYPSDLLLNNSDFYRLILGPINIALSLEENKRFNIFAKRWLLECVYSHPEVNKLKTLGYLKELDCYD